jgi:hypothetical protein
MASADRVLLTGCSSGGLAVILHCDQLRAFFPSGTTVVKCISDGGLYLDAYVPYLCCITHKRPATELTAGFPPMTPVACMQRGCLRWPEPEILLP